MCASIRKIGVVWPTMMPWWIWLKTGVVKTLLQECAQGHVINAIVSKSCIGIKQLNHIILFSFIFLFTLYFYTLVCNVTLPIVNCSASSRSEDCTKAFSESEGEYWDSDNTKGLEWIRLDLDDDYFINGLQVRQAGSHEVISITAVFSDYKEANQTLEKVSNKWLDVQLPPNITSSYINITTSGISAQVH